jgi:segregation and condensation protein A
VTPLGELTVRWTGDDDADVDDLITDEFDGAPPEAEVAAVSASGADEAADEGDDRDE